MSFLQMPGSRATVTELDTNKDLVEFVDRALDVTDLPNRTELKTAPEDTVFSVSKIYSYSVYYI